MQRVPDSSAADGDRAVKKRNLSARTPPQAASGALAVAEDPHSDVADASLHSQQLDHSVRRSTRPRTQRQKRELVHSVRGLGGSAALPSALAEAETRGDDSAWNGLSLRKAAAVCYELQSSTGSGSRLSLSAMADLFGLESKQSVNAWTKHKDFMHILKDDVFVEAAQAKFKELRDSAVAAAAAGKEKAAEQERGPAAAEKRQARANAKEQKLAQDIEDAGKLYERMEAVGFDIQQFKDGQQPAILTLRPMTIVLVHKMGFEDEKKLNGKKREEILNLFQERVKRLYDAIPRPRRSLRNRA